jgi:poly-gamma-glutamate capsule biosynthesis protein CapA/YwtB (metallophosphatase superfamily)
LSDDLLICAVGDIGPHRADPGEMFSALSGAFDGDFVFGQMECVLSDRGSPAPNARLPMRSSPEVAAALAQAGFDVMSLAGNHAMDYGGDALCDTVAHLRAAGIAACGGGAEIAEARRPAMLENKGRRIAFLAYSSILPEGYVADNRRPGCAPLRAHTFYEQVEPDQPGTDPRIRTFADEDDLAALLRDIEQAKKEADHVFVSMHWGIHFIRARLADYQRVVGRLVIEAGADAVIGHHPHLLKPVEFHRGRPIIHSLGNFAIEQPSAFMEDLAESRGFKEVSRTSNGWKPGEKYMLPDETRFTAVACLRPMADRCALSFIPFRIDDDCIPRRIDPHSPDFGAFQAYLEEITAEARVATRIAHADGGVLALAPD